MPNRATVLCALLGLTACHDRPTATLIPALSIDPALSGPWHLLRVGQPEEQVSIAVTPAALTVVGADGNAVATIPTPHRFNVIRDYSKTSGEETSNPIMETADVRCYDVDWDGSADPPFALVAASSEGTALDLLGFTLASDAGTALKTFTMLVCNLPQSP